MCLHLNIIQDVSRFSSANLKWEVLETGEDFSIMGEKEGKTWVVLIQVVQTQ